MANTTVPLQLPLNVFRVGRVFDRTISVYAKNFLPFSLITLVASAPTLLLTDDSTAGIFINTAPTATNFTTLFLVAILSYVLLLFGIAILVHGAFQSMRGRAVNLLDSVTAALARLFPIVGLILLAMLGIIGLFGIYAGIVLTMVAANFGFGRDLSQGPGLPILSSLIMIAAFILIFSGVLMLVTRWFVGIPVCMVERIGPWKSLKRSAELTKGHRWKVFGFFLLYVFISMVGQFIIVGITAAGGLVAWYASALAWNAVLSAFFATFVVVTYYELRSAKEGVDIETVASVFD